MGEISHDVSGIKTVLCVYAVNLTKTVEPIVENFFFQNQSSANFKLRVLVSDQGLQLKNYR